MNVQQAIEALDEIEHQTYMLLAVGAEIKIIRELLEELKKEDT